jgi:(1->4)-alpha-D-glucan 1-alpha-D-glucosylmutase
VSGLGLVNSLAQTLVRLTAPGVPDTYQGCELWDFSLVDPDNRRPVDYGRRAALLRELRERREAAGADRTGLAAELVAAMPDGRAKLYLTQEALRLRRYFPGLFTRGEYRPIVATGLRAAHVFAFERRLGGSRAVVAVPRLVSRLASGEGTVPLGPAAWIDAVLPLRGDAGGGGAPLRNILTGETITPSARPDGQVALAAADLFRHFPVALLISDGEARS